MSKQFLMSLITIVTASSEKSSTPQQVMAKVSEKPSTTQQGMSIGRVMEDDEEELLHEGFYTYENKPSDKRPDVRNYVHFAYYLS